MRPCDRTVRLSTGLPGHDLRASLPAETLRPGLRQTVRVQERRGMPPRDRCMPVPTWLAGQELPVALSGGHLWCQLYSALQVPQRGQVSGERRPVQMRARLGRHALHRK